MHIAYNRIASNIMRIHILILGLCVFGFSTCNKYGYTGNGETREYWMESGKAEIRRARNVKPKIALAKNVILFLGDGMGVSTATAARVLKGQLKGNPGEEESLSIDHFPHVGLSKTYNQDAQIGDSAGTATAFLSGVKTNFGVLGLDARARKGDCESQNGTEIETILDWVQAKGKVIGIVSNTRITHATPAALYAKTPHRDWESDTDMVKANVSGPCIDIASQLIDSTTDIRVILGGGRTKFLRNSDIDPESKSNSSSARSDGRNLIEDWMQKQANLGHSYRYVWNATEFRDVDASQTDCLMGLFGESHMHYVLDREDDVGGEPTLVEMTEKAIKILSKHSNGYFLLVESGRIDHAHHENWAKRALYETLEFDDAVQKGVDLTSEDDTLLLVTADHSHVFTMGGEQTRGNPIFGVSDDRHGGIKMAFDEKPFTTLFYANGVIGSSISTKTQALRPDPSLSDLENKEYLQQSGYPLIEETHAGEDVAIYARGPMSHLVHGVHEQSYVAHVVAYATCSGAYSDKNMCAMADIEETNSGGIVQLNTLIFLAVFLFMW